MASLNGKTAIVTGSGRGIGRAIALKLAREGAAVIVNDIDDEVGDAVAAEIQAAGGRSMAVNSDVTDADFGDRVVTAAIDTFGGLDIIVNNAGYTRDAVIEKQTDEQFEAMLDVHVMAPFRILRSAAARWRGMAAEERARGCEVTRKVVNISSISGLNGNPGQVNYAAAKSAVVGMTKTLAKEWGRLKVCVNCVGFGLIDTRLTAVGGDAANSIAIGGRNVRLGVPEGAREKVVALIPLGRSGTVEEAAEAVSFFCSPGSDYVSGQVLLVAGGLGV